MCYFQGSDVNHSIHSHVAVSALNRLISTIDGNHIDWIEYWKSCKGQFYFLNATCVELQNLNEKFLTTKVTRKNFGNAGGLLCRAGVEDIRTLRARLLAGIDEVPGIGVKKIRFFFSDLIRFIQKIEAPGKAHGSETFAAGDYTKNTSQTLYDEMSEEAASLPIDVLRLGSKTNNLRAHGINDLGQLLEVWPMQYPNSYGLGKSTLQKIEKNLSYIASATTEDGSVHWEQYAALIGVRLIPANLPEKHSNGFLELLPKAMAEVASTIDDPVLVDILLNRLTKRANEQKTLEQIALASKPVITRERVRQKEKKLLKQIAGGLLWHEYGNLNILFREEFASKWKEAAFFFEGQETVTFESFILGLAKIWEVGIPDVSTELPIILAIVTGEVQMPSEFRASDRLDSIFFGDIPESTRDITLTKFRLGKTVDELRSNGYETLGEFCDGCFSSDIFAECPRSAKRTADHLNFVSSSVQENGDFNWEKYRQSLGLMHYPTSERRNPIEFAKAVVEDLCQIIPKLRTPKRALEIFRLRTSRPSKSRLTLVEVARQLETHQPSVKQEETRLLLVLHNVLIDRDFSNVPIWIRPDFLFFWEEAQAAYEISDEDYSVFIQLITDCWLLSSELADSSVPTLWAVLDGYPKGRPARVRRKKQAVNSQSSTNSPPTGTIRLAGFRRVH